MGIGNGKIASLEYAQAATKNTFSVTIVTNLGEVVSNTQVHCTTNGQDYTTNSSGQILQNIETDLNIKSLQFTWTATISGTHWDTANGSLQRRTGSINTYTGVATITSGTEFSGNTITTVQSTNNDEYRINSSTVRGSIITIGSYEYIIAHSTASIVYAILRYWNVDATMGEYDYASSRLAAKCNDWYSEDVPAIWRSSAKAFTKVTTEGVSAQCFIPTYSQVSGGWDYFNSDDSRVFVNLSDEAKYWWTSTWETNNRFWVVTDTGTFTEGRMSSFIGFRPALAIKRSLFTS